jgi:hypothetical protein
VTFFTLAGRAAPVKSVAVRAELAEVLVVSLDRGCVVANWSQGIAFVECRSMRIA